MSDSEEEEESEEEDDLDTAGNPYKRRRIDNQEWRKKPYGAEALI